MTMLDRVIVPRLRDYWMRLALRRVHYADRADRLEMLYRVENPWKMDSAQEQARFDWTNRLIARLFGPLDTILEIGCGEGHQSRHLSRLCDRLYGLDVSERAVRRARQRCPQASFAAGDLFAFDLPQMPQPVDLAAACEVLYYVRDIPQFLDRLSRLGRACLVTYYHGHVAALDPYFAALPVAGRDSFRFGEVEWHAVWWCGNSSR